MEAQCRGELHHEDDQHQVLHRLRRHPRPHHGRRRHIPANLCPTLEKPDLVIIDEKKKTVDLFELTVPGELRISVSNKLKADRYDHFKKDINNEYKTTITPFEISCTGHVTRENRDRLRKIHKFTDKSKTLKQFIQDISYITILSSYYIFIARNEPAWSDPPFITPPSKVRN